MSVSNLCLPPSSSLPILRRIETITASQVKAALLNLRNIYCPLRLPPRLARAAEVVHKVLDSGYVSEDELDEGNVNEHGLGLSVLRADTFERAFAVRWLTTLISRVEELDIDEDERVALTDEACFILSAFSDAGSEDGDESLVRDFSFPTSTPGTTVDVQLNDAQLSGTDHTDVGLQSWGASIIFSELMCASPDRFELPQLCGDASIIELGAGTGLISLTLAKLLPPVLGFVPSITATDYHPAVLENLQANIATSFPRADPETAPVKTALLDWSKPPSSLCSSVQMLFAADVIYAPEHAFWIRDCAISILASTGVFWLIVTVRKHGKFEGIPDTAEVAFTDKDCPRAEDGRVLRILEKKFLEKKRGIGRGDETGYTLYKIGWQEV